MLDQVVRRVAALAAAPALFVLSAPAVAHGPFVPPRPAATPRAAATPTPSASGPATAPRARDTTRPATRTPERAAATVAPRPAMNPAQVRARAAMVQVARLTNEERKQAGCPALAVDGHLVTASLRQSTYMARTRLFSHVWRDGSTFVERSQESGYRQPAGENIAWGYRSAPEVVQAWMGSPGHRKNILNCKAKSMGAGVAYAADGTPYYTQVFGWR